MRLMEYSNGFLVRGGSKAGLRERLLDMYQEELRRRSPRRLDVSGDRVSFTAGIFRLVNSWNLLGPINRGEIVVKDAGGNVSVRYRISFHELVAVVTLLLSFLFIWIMVIEGLSPPGFIFVSFGLAWAIGVGLNVVVAVFRFSSFVKKCAMLAGATEIEQERHEFARRPTRGNKKGGPFDTVRPNAACD